MTFSPEINNKGSVPCPMAAKCHTCTNSNSRTRSEMLIHVFACICGALRRCVASVTSQQSQVSHISYTLLPLLANVCVCIVLWYVPSDTVCPYSSYQFARKSFIDSNTLIASSLCRFEYLKLEPKQWINRVCCSIVNRMRSCFDCCDWEFSSESSSCLHTELVQTIEKVSVQSVVIFTKTKFRKKINCSSRKFGVLFLFSRFSLTLSVTINNEETHPFRLCCDWLTTIDNSAISYIGARWNQN